MASDHDLHDANDDARDAAQAALFRHHVADDADDVTIILYPTDAATIDSSQRQVTYPAFPWWHMWNAGEAFQHPDNAGARENFVGPFETEAAALADNAAGPDEPLPFERLAPGDAD